MITIQRSIDTEEKIPLHIFAVIKRVIVTAAKVLDIKNDLSISLSLVSVQIMTELNGRHRNIHSVTDVLSFPSGNEENPGDIVICPEVAREQAADFGHSFEREMAFLAVHGFLHLMGYDHDTPEREENMILLQKEILKTAGIPR